MSNNLNLATAFKTIEEALEELCSNGVELISPGNSQLKGALLFSGSSKTILSWSKLISQQPALKMASQVLKENGFDLDIEKILSGEIKLEEEKPKHTKLKPSTVE